MGQIIDFEKVKGFKLELDYEILESHKVVEDGKEINVIDKIKLYGASIVRR